MVTDLVRKACASLEDKQDDLPLDRLLRSVTSAIESIGLNQNDDGGWGEARGRQSEVLLTSRVIQALHSLGLSPEHMVIRDGLLFLRNAFLWEQGAWGRHISLALGDEKSTAYALWGIGNTNQLADFEPDVNRAVSYLLNAQIDGKGWFEGWGYKRASDVVTTAWVILALQSVAPNDMKVRRAIADAQAWMLSDSLRLDGGWRAESNPELQPSIIPTALALRALAGVGCQDLAIHEGVQYLLKVVSSDGSWSNDPVAAPAHATAETLVTLSMLAGDLFSGASETVIPMKMGLTWLVNHRPAWLVETGRTAMVAEIGSMLLPSTLEQRFSLDTICEGVIEQAIKARERGKKAVCFKTIGGECTADTTLDPRKVFVAMPSKDEYRDAYRGIDTALRQFELEPVRADMTISNIDVMCKICSMIRSSRMAVVEISEWNANVLFELGLCYGIGLETVILKRRGTDVPTDLKGIEYLEWSHSDEIAAKLSQFLERTRT